MLVGEGRVAFRDVRGQFSLVLDEIDIRRSSKLADLILGLCPFAINSFLTAFCASHLANVITTRISGCSIYAC